MIDPFTLSSQELPADEVTCQAILAGRISVQREAEEALVAHDKELDPYLDEGIPLKYALLYRDATDTAPYLVDVRAAPTAEDRQASPALYSQQVMRCREHLCPSEVAQQILNVFSSEATTPRPTCSVGVTSELENLQRVHTMARINFDRRYYAALQSVVAALRQQHFPSSDAEIEQHVEHKHRAFYFALQRALHNAELLLAWYQVSTLYVIEQVSARGMATLAHTVVGSNLHRAEMEFAAFCVHDRSYDPAVVEWRLYANDSLLWRIQRSDSEPDARINALYEEWVTRTKDTITNCIM